MQSLPAWLDAATFRQDYLWFVLAAGWGSLLVWPRSAALPGLRVLGGATIVHALCEIVGMLILGDSSGRANTLAEAFFSLVANAAPMAIFTVGGRRRFGFAPAMGLLLFAGALVFWLLTQRMGYPLAAALGLSLVALFAGSLGAWWLRPVSVMTLGGWLWLGAGFAAALAPMMGSCGFVAEVLGWPRRWLTASPVGVFAALWQWAVLVVAYLACHKAADTKSVALRQNLGQGLLLLAIWLGLGSLLVEAAGQKTYAEFVHSLRARARTCLGTMDRVGLENCLGPTFTLERVRPAPNFAWKALIADAPSTLSPLFELQRNRLARLAVDNPDINYVRIFTLRKNYLVTAVATSRTGFVSIQREVTAEDAQRWTQKSGYVEGPVWSPFGTLLTVAEPITGASGRMLGWLVLRVDSNQILAAQAPARLLMGLTVGMGTILGIGYVLLRARGQAQREAAAQAAAALAADRLKSALLAHVSHELRTPLQGILGYAELLAGRPLDEEQRGWLSAQRRQGELLQRLVNDLIDLGALQSGAFTFAARSAALTPLVEETVLSLRPRAHIRQLTLDLDTDPALPAWLVFDPDRVRQILLNLVGNALKFTAEGGVVVNLRLVSLDAGTAHVEIAVADTGPGIASTDQARLFRPFTRLEATLHHEGAGLGLALAHGLCVGLGGALTVESDGHTGTTFRARLALPLGVPPPTPNEPGIAPSTAHAGLRIVVADDNTLVRELYVAHLSAQGATCTAAADGAAAVAAVLGAQPLPDVLVLDLAMPQLDGLAVARRLRRQGPVTLRIIGVSAHGNPEHRALALAAGMNDFLVKPVRLSELSRSVQHHVGRAAQTTSSQLPEALRQKLREIFDRETPTVLTALDTALAGADWAALEARAHYLKNSAHALGESELAALCEALCAAARAPTAISAATQLAALRVRLRALTIGG